MTLREKQRERWREATRLYRARHPERVRERRRALYDPIRQREYQFRYQAAHPERIEVLVAAKNARRKPAALAYAKARSRQRSELLAKIKLQHGCVDCGYRAHHAALDFDHLGDKSAEIAALRTCALDRLLAEVAKCEVVCANCHRVRTERRRAERRAS